MLKKTLLILPLLLTLSHANPKPIIQIGFESGGDELITIDHDYESDYTIKAGDGFRFELGMAIEDPLGVLEVQFLAGYKFDSDSADNGSITWSMIPLSALGFIKIPGWKFGGGLTYHINPELDGSFRNYNYDDDIKDEFKSALGGIMQIQYEPIDAFALGLRATFIDYELKRDNSKTANGNAIGLICTFKFGGKRSRFR
ncbi:DUF481 domain-containing protein [Sulfurovum sp. bin170]|uniref:outer membrane beta-barrel protein n=1 Tax=Sulfurovum sp. bin170 TaxID=2695268 RepID=UPI0013E0A91A|nr:outer membrane beta-barrel protein [Sulfurovum sp. bin170]NEW61056.1 DUF481 domain-containing protein [Sulfurovum sp. bin170]